MKKNFGIILAIALGLSALLLTIGFQAGWVKAYPFNQERAGAPTIVSYQGQIWDGATPFDGTGYFKFAILDSSGSTQYWSNDTLTNPPTIYVSLPVVKGLFSVNLGDTSLTGMIQSLTTSVFNNPDTVLRVWFSPNGSAPWTQMPDQKIAAVPYALQSQNSNLLNNKRSSDYQLRVSTSCGEGSAIKTINSDGSVICESIPNAATFSLSTIVSIGDVGKYNSMAIGTDGLGLISYIDNSNVDLKVAHCSNIDCTSATISVLQTMGHNTEDTSIAIGSDGLGVISYYYTTFMDLMVAHCSNELCLPINWAH